MFRNLLALSVTWSLVLPLGTSTGQKMYWADPEAGVIQRANLDGSNVETVVPKFRPTGTAVDVAGGKIYWTDAGSNPRIQRANLDGTAVEDLVTGLGIPFGIALDLTHGKLYWTDALAGKVQRANLDGSSVEDVVVSGVSLRGLAVDEIAGQIYWTDFGTDSIHRANLDGSFSQDLIVGGDRGKEPEAIALDLNAGKMYWVARRCVPVPFCLGWPMIHRANLDGSNPETVIDSLGQASMNSAQAVAIDATGQKIYWTNRRFDDVRRMDFDGTGIENLVTNEFGSLQGIALDPAGGRMFWADAGGGRLRTAMLDGDNVATIAEIGFRTEPYSLAIDSQDQTLYWGEVYPSWPQRILRSPLAALNVEVTVPGDSFAGGAYDLAVDPSGGKMYWVEGGCECDVCFGYGRLRQANLDGSGSQTLGPAMSFPIAVAMDLNRQKLYWADRGGAGWNCDGPARIYRSELDGTLADWLVQTPGYPLQDVAVDLVGSKIYWILGAYDSSDDATIMRSSFDGSEIESVITAGLGTATGLAIDAIARKLYWTDTGYLPTNSGRIMRANLDGTGIEELVVTRGLRTGPTRIVLDVEQPHSGACCDVGTGICSNDVLMQACEGVGLVWTQHVLCDLLDPPCACDDDTDGDGVCDPIDICPGFDDAIDSDGDGTPNGCDACPGFDDAEDSDGDDVPDACDMCPGFDDSRDSDGDGVSDGCDICPGVDDALDSDGDGVRECHDQCPGVDDSIFAPECESAIPTTSQWGLVVLTLLLLVGLKISFRRTRQAGTW